jgi:hypothetical protein
MSVLNIGTTSFYRHSGRAPILGLILLGAAGFILIPILAVIYGYLIYYVPSLSIYLGILLVLAYAFAGGYILSKAASLGKIRNKLIVFLAALAFGLFAEYVGWVAWIAALAEDPTFLIEFFFPLDILYLITEIAKEGVWSISGGTPTGGALYGIWLAEAIMVVGGMIYFALQSSSDVPFCEESDAWAGKKSVLGFFAPLTDIAAFRSAIEQGNLSVFNELKPVQSGSVFTMFDLYECDVCKNFFVLNVRDVKITTDYRGRQNRKEKKVVSNLIVSPSTISGLKRLFEEQQGRQAAG